MSEKRPKRSRMNSESDDDFETLHVQGELPSSPEVYKEEMFSSDPVQDTSLNDPVTDNSEGSFLENQQTSTNLAHNQSTNNFSDLETSLDPGQMYSDSQPETEPNPEPELDEEPETDFHLKFGSLLFQSSVDDQELEVESDCEDYEEDKMPHMNKPVYSGATITLHESLVAILTVVLHFRVCGQLLHAILRLIQLHCLEAGNIFKTSLYFFKKYLSNVQSEKSFKYFCSVCYQEIDKKGCNNCKGSKICYLVKLSITSQLQSMFNRDGFYSQLRMFNESHVPGIYKDIYDGDVYQEAFRKGYVGVKDHISFQWYTDGAALFTSSKMSVWPLMLTINELPFSKRFLKQNVLIPLIWCGPVKPPSNLLINEAYSDISSLKNGVKFSVKNEGDKIIKGVLLCGTALIENRRL